MTATSVAVEGDETGGVIVAGVDVGNSTTEVAVALVRDGEPPRFLGAALAPTTGFKGTVQAIPGIERAVAEALADGEVAPDALAIVLLHEAAPVVADVATQMITETVVAESTMVGHNPSTPGGWGLGVGVLVPFDALARDRGDAPPGDVVVAIPRDVHFAAAAGVLAGAMGRGWAVVAAIVQSDDGVLIANRLPRPLPIVDEVDRLDLLPVGQRVAVEVAAPGHGIRALCNPYALAGLLGLDVEETRRATPVARALAGLRSGVVARLPPGQSMGRTIPSGGLTLRGRHVRHVDTRAGAEAIMGAVEEVWPLEDVEGEGGTNVGAMLASLRETMGAVTGEPPDAIRVRDLLAVDLLTPRPVQGAIAGGSTLESAVGLAALVRATPLPMAALAEALAARLGTEVRVGGAEAALALRGALTSPGVGAPVAVVDLGAGSVDAATASATWGVGEVGGAERAPVRTVHLAGAGELVTVLIDAALGLDDRDLAEQVKRRPAARVEDLFRLRLEDGTALFLTEPAPTHLFGRTVLLGDGPADGTDGLVGLPAALTLDAVRVARRAFKEKVLVRNTLRALRAVARSGDARELRAVVLVGGCALDGEAAGMITRRLAELGVVAGCAEVRGSAGPRNAVATGLVLAYVASCTGGSHAV